MDTSMLQFDPIFFPSTLSRSFHAPGLIAAITVLWNRCRRVSKYVDTSSRGTRLTSQLPVLPLRNLSVALSDKLAMLGVSFVNLSIASLRHPSLCATSNSCLRQSSAIYTHPLLQISEWTSTSVKLAGTSMSARNSMSVFLCDPKKNVIPSCKTTPPK